jgi:hypothetical protein
VNRRAFKLLLFLLVIGGGAIINVAVAWGCAAYLWRFFPSEEFTRPMVESTSIAHAPFGCKYELSPHFEVIREYEYAMSLTEDTRSYGLPCLSVKSVVYGYADATGWVGGWDLPWREKLLRGYPTARLPAWTHASYSDRLAIIPIWPGFVLNTIFYAAIGWFMVAASGAVRQRVRIKRSQCAACGYDLRGSASDQCPECGEALPAFNRPGRAADLANSSACMIETIRM